MQALEVNRKLDKMRVSISKHYQEIMDRDNFVTADKVKNAFLGLEYRCHTLMKVYSQSRDEMEKQYKAGMKSLSTYTKYRIGCAYVGEFLQTHYHVKDIALKELSLPFITNYETFFVTADKVKNAFLGLEYRCHTLMKVYSQSRDEMEKQYKAGMKSLSTYTKYRIGCAYVGEFLQTHYHVKDIALKELSLPFITNYETFLRIDKQLKINSAMVFVRNLRAMIFRAIDNEWLVKDPFRRYEYKNEETTREILTKEEIYLLMETPVTRKKMSMVRDLFLFCCFTGLAFIDL